MIILGQFPNGQGLAQALETGAVRAVDRWSVEYHRTTRRAFFLGGHLHHGGRQWHPRKRQYFWPILRKTGALKRSIERRSEGKSAGIATWTEYARFHQLGTRNMAARPVIEFTETDDWQLLQLVRRELNRAINGRI